MRCFGGLLRVLMKFEGVVTPDVFDLAGLDVVLGDLRIRVVVVAAAEGTLKIRELNDCHFGVRGALERLFADVHRCRRQRIGSGASLPLLREQSPDSLKLLEDQLLGLIQRID